LTVNLAGFGRIHRPDSIILLWLAYRIGDV